MTDTPPRSTPTPPMTSHSKRRASLAVVSVNYRTADLAIDAARSVVDELAAIGGRCVIVDNFSADGSVARLQGFAASPAARGVVHIVASPVNGGFSAGNNLGFAAIDADWYLLLNSDASAAPGALSAMLRAAESAPGCGLVTPTIADRQGGAQVSRFRRHSPLGELIEGAQTGPVTRLFQRASAPIAPDDWATPPDWVSFAAVMINAEAIARVGAMDEGFFLYYEDCDFCHRITDAGFSIAFAPDAAFVHEPGGTTGIEGRIARGEALPAYYYKARSRYFTKHDGRSGLLLANIAWLAGRAIARARGLIGRPAPPSPRGKARDIWIGWSGVSRK